MIFVECKPDEALVCTLGVSRREVIHAGGKSRICKRLEKITGAKGLVDEDPYSDQPPYMQSLKLVAKSNDILVLHDPRRSNYLIVLCPRLEEWVLKAARIAGVRPEEYGLPGNGDELHRVINLRVDKFTLLVSDLRARSGMIRCLERLLRDPAATSE